VPVLRPVRRRLDPSAVAWSAIEDAEEGQDVISIELEAKILRLYHVEHWRIGTIASQLGIHHSTVRRAIDRGGTARRPCRRPSMIEPYLPFILSTLERYPKLRASRLYEMVRDRGYRGGPDHFRHQLVQHRPRPPAEAYLKLRTFPAEQAQVDWAHFGTTRIGRATRILSAFVMILSFSRHLFVRFFLDQRLANFLRGHVAAFGWFGGSVRVVLYDNLKTAVLERRDDAIRFHPELLALAAHYRFEPRPVAPARGSDKGRVERAIQYLRHSFFAARPWWDVDDLNAQVERWCAEPAASRPWPEDRTRTVRDAFEQERDSLLSLPDEPYPTEESVEVSVGKHPYVRFDGNDYSVPHALVRRTLVIRADLERVRVLDGFDVVATHARSFDAGACVEDPGHIAALIQDKRKARQGRATDRLARAAPSSRKLLVLLAERGENLGAATTALVRLLDRYGAGELELAIAEAVGQGVGHPHAVRHVLERRRRERDQPPPVPVELPDDPRVRDLVVRPHALDTYDTLRERPKKERTHGDHRETEAD
jgi:transposase